MTSFFKPYEGTHPFLFISYAHKQSAEVVATIRILHEKGYRLWYDEGIPAGSDWPANIAQHMQSCERVVFFLSRRSLESPNCYSEIRTAARLKKPILVVRLEDAEPNAHWEPLLKGRQELPLCADAAERAASLLSCGFITRRFRQSWTEKISWRALGLAASLLFFLAAAGALAALATGRWNPFPPPEPPAAVTPEPTLTPTEVPTVDLGEAERFFAVSFSNAQLERAIRGALGNSEGEVYRWQLAQIRELYFCGNMTLQNLDGVSFDKDGACRVNGAPVIQGKIDDLSLLSNAARLEHLALICQPLGSLVPLKGLTLLRELSLAGSTVSRLDELRDLASLQVLHLEHTDVRDLSPLDALSDLKTVTVSRDMLPLKWSGGAAFHVILVD